MATSKWFSMGKDVTNAALISFSTAMGKDSMQSSVISSFSGLSLN